MEWKTCVSQKSAQTAQTFAAVHSAIATVWRNGGVGACPQKKVRVAYSTTLENAILQDRRSTRISMNCMSFNL